MMNGGGSSPPSSSARLTPEQRAIIALVKPPGSVPAEGEMVRVTSGAGTGKTTTLEHLAARAVKLGHKQIVLLTYNKSAAADAGHKLGRHADCRTAHSAAFRCLGYNNKEEDADVIDDAQLSKKAVAMFSGEIEANMLRECVNLQGSRRSAVLKQIANFIVKTFVRFIQSDDSLSDGFNHKKSTNTYYPAQLWHAGKGRGSKKPKGVPLEYGDFYTSRARRLFEALRPSPTKILGERNQVTYGSVLKEAQLQGIQIPCSLLLVDESQDLDKAQLAWMVAQRRPGRQIYFVGDAVQNIYTFRGARSKYLTDLRGIAAEPKLTSCFRFGSNIGAVANTILFAKQNSPQVVEWTHYRLVPRGQELHAPNVHLAPYDEAACGIRRTIVGRTNLQLLVAALEILEKHPHMRFCLNGKGENSGTGKWNRDFEAINVCFRVFQGDEGAVRELNGFEEECEGMSWDRFKDRVKGQELGQFSNAIGLVTRYKEDTLYVVDQFKVRVLDRECSASEADIILSTTHAAKGMEWDVVHVQDDYIDLALFQFTTAQARRSPTKFYSAATSLQQQQNDELTAQFSFHNWGDDVNLWYVAVTRTKRHLILPPKFKALLECFQRVIELCTSFEEDGDGRQEEGADYFFLPPFASEAQAQESKQLFSREQIIAIHKTIVVPWIQEMDAQLAGGHRNLLRLVGSQESFPSSTAACSPTSTTSSTTATTTTTFSPVRSAKKRDVSSMKESNTEEMFIAKNCRKAPY